MEMTFENDGKIENEKRTEMQKQPKHFRKQ